MKRMLLLALFVILAAIVLYTLARPASSPGVSADIVVLQSDEHTAGYARADRPRAFTFPDDHGPHPAYQTEWWYYTGNLDASDGRHFGYQLTFFRRAITPTVDARDSDWATNQIYFAHFAIMDVKGNSHISTERFSRGAAGLAGATGKPYRAWLENWEVSQVPRPASGVQLPISNLQSPISTYHLHANDTGLGTRDIGLDLTLSEGKPPVLHGDGGLSQKTNVVGNASYYVSLTRLATDGTVTINGETFAVRGLSWMDHEFGTTGLGPQAIGWDWFSLELGDQRELMFFQIRQRDGSLEPLSSGTLIEPDGTTKHLTREQVNINVLDRWTSAYSKATYPSRWTVSIPSEDINLTLAPFSADQEMKISFTYWEGAVAVSGTARGAAVTGVGYVELTGYAGAIPR